MSDSENSYLIPSNEESVAMVNEIKIRTRSAKQKENDVKLSKRLQEYHMKRREEKIKALNKEIDEFCQEIRKEVLDELPVKFEIMKAKRGRPKKFFSAADVIQTQSL